MILRVLISSAVAALALAACSEPAPAPLETPAPAAPPHADEAAYVGVWAGPQADCSNAPASGERAPIQITRTGFLGYENRCDIRSLSPEGAVFDAVLDCEAEGMTTRERVRMTVQDDILDLTYADRDGVSARLRRCSH